MTNSTVPLADKGFRAAFLVGVTGYMDLVPDEIPVLQKRLRTLFRFLRHGATSQDLNELVVDLVPDDSQKPLRRTYRRALADWTGLGSATPIIVMTNLAPGVDTLVANLVLDEFQNDNFHLLCPLPFPPEVYLGATTFVRERDGTPDPNNLERQCGFLRVLEKMNVVSQGLAAQATEQEELPPEIDQELKQVPRDRVFPVFLKSDPTLSVDQRDAQWRKDRDDRDRRNLRYYAAGEYLTTAAHLLVAIWNGERDASDSGTSAVVEARLFGPRHGLLPTTSDVPLPHGGPVWHLLANRPGAPAVQAGDRCAAVQSVPLPLPRLRILHPYMLTTGECREARIVAVRQPADAELQSERLRMLARIGESLKRFNARNVNPPKSRKDEFAKMMAAPKLPLRETLQQQSPSFAAGLRHVSETRRRASEITDFWQGRAKRTMTVLFWLTFLAAVLLHGLSHWTPREANDPGKATAAVDSDDERPTTAKPDDGSHGPSHHAAHHAAHFSMIQLACGWLALGLAAAAVGYFAIQRARQLEEQGHDARAIAEGIRVQFYWNLAGMGDSVSANYMSRHRSELDWILGVIRAASLPYHQWADWFRGLPRETQVQALRVVQEGWVRNQLVYFRNSRHREEHKLHLWHTLGGVAALAGVFTFLKLVSHEAWPRVADTVGLVCGGWSAIGLLVLTAGVSLVREFQNAQRRAASGQGASPALFPDFFKSLHNLWVGPSTSTSTPTSPAAEGKERGRVLSWPARGAARIPLALRAGIELVACLVPSPQHAANRRTRVGKRMLRGAVGFAAHIPLALLVACGSFTLCEILAAQFPSFPSSAHLEIIAGGILLLGGALSVAWAEKCFHSEWAYQYNTMAGLFQAANLRLERQLAELQAAVEANDDAKCQETLHQIRALLSELGQEALDENAEWLLLHRARPLEPVMAG